MKSPLITPVTLTALALVLAAPQASYARSSGSHFAPHFSHTPAATPSRQSIPVVHTSSGLIDTTTNGEGSYTRTVTREQGMRTVDTTDTFANGKSYTTDTTYTRNANGTINSDSTRTFANGKSVTIDDTLTKTGAGDYSINGTYTQANGKVDEVTGTRDATSYGTDTNLSIENAAGKTATINDESMRSGDASANVVTGTGFQGQAINYASVRTTDTAPNVNTVDTTVNGHGGYSIGSSQSNGTTTVGSDRVFGNGAGTTSINQTTVNPSGGRTVNVSTQSIASNGVLSSSDTNETYTPSGKGTSAISGTFTQSNGHEGTVSGTSSQTIYGNDTATTYTDQNGLTRTANTEHLTAGDAILNVNTGTTFNGQSSDSNGLITGQASQY